MHTGELYLPGDEEIAAAQLKCLDRLYDYNMTRPTEAEKRTKMLEEDVRGHRRRRDAA